MGGAGGEAPGPPNATRPPRVPLVGVASIVYFGLYCFRNMCGCAGVLGHWGVTAVLGVNVGQVAHTCWGSCRALGYAQEDLEHAVHHILYFRNCGIQQGERDYG